MQQKLPQQQQQQQQTPEPLLSLPTADLLRRVADAAAAHERRCAVAAEAAAAQRAEQAALLQSVYEQLDAEVFFSKGGWVIPPRERALIDAISAGAATYGEIEAEGVASLLDLLGLEAGDAFCDLGSGIGRVVLSAAMTTGVREAVGLELSDSRLEQAEAAAAVLSGLGVATRPTRFVRADLLSCDLEAASGGATHYFACSTAFGAALCRSLAERLARCAPSFKVLVTSRPLPPQVGLIKAGEVGGVRYSWIRGGSLHVYVRDFESAPPGVLARLWARDGVCWAPERRAPWVRGLCAPDELAPAAAAAAAAAAVAAVGGNGNGSGGGNGNGSGGGAGGSAAEARGSGGGGEEDLSSA